MEPPGGRGDSRFNLAYSMNLLSGETAADIYGTNPLGRGPQNSTSLPQMTNTRHSMISTVCGSQRNTSSGMKSNTPESCYDEHRGMTSAQSLGLDSCGVPEIDQDQYTSMQPKKSPPSNGKKTKGRVKIKMEYIENKLRRYTTFSKRKTGIMKKAYELSTLTGTQVMLLVASETGHVYTFATRKLQPMITSEAGKALIQTCLNSPDPPGGGSSMGGSGGDQRMSATGFEETELTYNISDDDLKVRQLVYGGGNGGGGSGGMSAGGNPHHYSHLAEQAAAAAAAAAAHHLQGLSPGGGGGGGQFSQQCPSPLPPSSVPPHHHSHPHHHQHHGGGGTGGAGGGPPLPPHSQHHVYNPHHHPATHHHMTHAQR